MLQHVSLVIFHTYSQHYKKLVRIFDIDVFDQRGVNGRIIQINPFVEENDEKPQVEALHEGSKQQVSKIDDLEDDNLSLSNKEQTDLKKTNSEVSFLTRKKKGVRVSLKNRKDVILKSTLRSVKKLLILAFNRGMPQSRFASKYKKLRRFEYSIRKFVDNLSLPCSANNESSIAGYDKEML